MKKTKLLAPLLGVASVATVVAPIATSCGAVQTNHAIATPVIEKSTDDDMVAQYLFLLDSPDYDKNGFTINTAIKESTNGLMDSDFETTFSVNKNQLIVNVQFVGEDLPRVNTKVPLDITIKYGSMWTNTISVKMNIVVDKGINLIWQEINSYWYFASPTGEWNEGKSYKVVVKMKDWLSRDPTIEKPNSFRFRTPRLTLNELRRDQPGFKEINVYKNSTKLTPGEDYDLVKVPTPSLSGNWYGGVSFTQAFVTSLNINDTITFECNELNIETTTCWFELYTVGATI